MSFGLSNIGPKKQPTILEAQNMQNNGGGGNLGYFQQERKRKDEGYEDDANTDCFIREDGDLFDKKGNMTFLEKLRKLFFGK
ncbi:hypothetical protein IJC60_02385 [bacterium]|nr:hypothetical protein [bacterium]